MKKVYIIKQGYFNFNHGYDVYKGLPIIEEDDIIGDHCLSSKEKADKIVIRLNKQGNFDKKKSGFYAYVVSLKVK